MTKTPKKSEFGASRIARPTASSLAWVVILQALAGCSLVFSAPEDQASPDGERLDAAVAIDAKRGDDRLADAAPNGAIDCGSRPLPMVLHEIGGSCLKPVGGQATNLGLLIAGEARSTPRVACYKTRYGERETF